MPDGYRNGEDQQAACRVRAQKSRQPIYTMTVVGDSRDLLLDLVRFAYKTLWIIAEECGFCYDTYML